MASTFAFSMLLSLTLAQTTTVTVPFMGYDNFNIVASVVSANAAATTLQLACTAGTDGSDCGLFPYQTLIYGPSTYNMDMSDSDFTMTQDCNIASSSAVCKESASGASANFPGSSTTSYGGGADENFTVFPVTVTKGADQLIATAKATPTAAGSAAASTGSRASGTLATATKSSASGTSSASGSSSGTAIPSAAQHTGAAVVNTMTLKDGLVGGILCLIWSLVL